MCQIGPTCESWRVVKMGSRLPKREKNERKKNVMLIYDPSKQVSYLFYHIFIAHLIYKNPLGIIGE